MNATSIPIECFASFEEWEATIQQANDFLDVIEQEIIITNSLAKLPPGLPPQDRLLFAAMLSNIMDAPVSSHENQGPIS